MKHQRLDRSLRDRMVMRFLFPKVSIAVVLLAGAVLAQNDIYIYPARGQSQAQQDKDRYECHSWAVKETGFDPSKPETAAPGTTASKPYQASQPHVARGAARGAALGAVGGAITGNAGKGAAAAAAMGVVAGGFRRRDERRQMFAQQQLDVRSAEQGQLGAYHRAMAACLRGRGYTVN